MVNPATVAAALVLSLLAGCGKVGPLSLPEGAPQRDVGSDVLVIDDQDGISRGERVSL